MTDLRFQRRTPILDGRLSAAMALAEDSRVFADIGADHGRLSAVMLLADERRRALISDISAKALSKAQSRIRQLLLAERVIFAVADGLDALDAIDKTVDTVFVLGMGGDTVSGILQRGAAKLSGAALVLGAQTDLPLLRERLCDIGYRIRREVVVRDSGRDYVLFRAEPALPQEPVYTEEELLLGPMLLKEKPLSWLPVLKRRERLLSQAIRAMEETQLSKDTNRLIAFQREFAWVCQTLKAYEKG